MTEKHYHLRRSFDLDQNESLNKVVDEHSKPPTCHNDTERNSSAASQTILQKNNSKTSISNSDEGFEDQLSSNSVLEVKSQIPEGSSNCCSTSSISLPDHEEGSVGTSCTEDEENHLEYASTVPDKIETIDVSSTGLQIRDVSQEEKEASHHINSDFKQHVLNIQNVPLLDPELVRQRDEIERRIQKINKILDDNPSLFKSKLKLGTAKPNFYDNQKPSCSYQQSDSEEHGLVLAASVLNHSSNLELGDSNIPLTELRSFPQPAQTSISESNSPVFSRANRSRTASSSEPHCNLNSPHNCQVCRNQRILLRKIHSTVQRETQNKSTSSIELKEHFSAVYREHLKEIAQREHGRSVAETSFGRNSQLSERNSLLSKSKQKSYNSTGDMSRELALRQKQIRKNDPGAALYLHRADEMLALHSRSTYVQPKTSICTCNEYYGKITQPRNRPTIPKPRLVVPERRHTLPEISVDPGERRVSNMLNQRLYYSPHSVPRNRNAVVQQPPERNNQRIPHSQSESSFKDRGCNELEKFLFMDFIDCLCFICNIMEEVI